MPDLTYTPVAGTEDWSDPDGGLSRWWQSGSAFTALMLTHGWHRRGWSWHGIELPAWSTQLAGTFFSGRDDRTWKRGAYGLAEEMEQVPVSERNLIAHSHGGNLAVKTANLLAPYGGLHRLVTVCTPRRRSMADEYTSVHCPWLHLYSSNVWTNRMQWMGARWGKWTMPSPARNVRVKGIGHSKLLRQPTRFASEISDLVVGFLLLPDDTSGR